MRVGSRIDTGHLSVSWVPNHKGNPRLGLVVPLYGGTAVSRNRLRRRLKEVARVSVMGKLDGTDVVIRAKPNAYRTDFSTLRVEILRWFGSLSD
jgi:ribonuclease P protein component